MAGNTTSVSIEDIDALVSGATPQFSMQIKARLHALISNCPVDSDVRAYGERHLEALDALAMGTTRGERSPGRPATAEPGWRNLPSHPRGGSVSS